MIAPYFKDSALEQEINEMGFVVLPGFLPEAEVEILLSTYRALHTERTQRCWNSHQDLSIEEGIKVSDQITGLMRPRLEALFTDWLFPYAQFISKNPGVEHGCGIHRDDSIFDENKIQFRQLWMPLVDLTKDNGALYVVPKSHKLFTDIKPTFAKWPYEYLIPALEKEYVTLYLKAGDLVIWIDKTLHGSYENVSAHTRPVFQGGVIHKDTPPVFNRYVPERDVVETYEVDPRFFMYKEYLLPEYGQKYHLLSSEKYSFTPYTESDLQKFFHG